MDKPAYIPQMIYDVQTFMQIMGQPTQSSPRVPEPARQVLRNSLNREEYMEINLAWDACADAKRRNLPLEFHIKALANLADGIADMIYVLIGMALEYGLPLHEVWQVVQNANMSKLWTQEEVATLNNGQLPEKWTTTTIISIHHPQRCVVVRDDSGKVRKPPSWTPPDIEDIIRKKIYAALQRKVESIPDSRKETNHDSAGTPPTTSPNECG